MDNSRRFFMCLIEVLLIFTCVQSCLGRSENGLGFENEAISRNLSQNAKQSFPPRSGLQCGKGNPVNDCWQCDSHWEKNRQDLTQCAFGFGESTYGGRHGSIYVVTDSSDIDAANPTPGTLRYAAIQIEALWLTFSHDMTIVLSEQLCVTSYKSFDGRGKNVHIANGASFVIRSVSHIIIHGLYIHDIIRTGPAKVRTSVSRVVHHGKTEGDVISVNNCSHIWIDHNYLARGIDGLIDITDGSSHVTISNNYLTDHNKVILLSSKDSDSIDVNMRVTVAFNHFGPGLHQRLPRCRWGDFHVANNYYEGWSLYAIGGSTKSTIRSEGNYFDAKDSPKEVTKRMDSSVLNWQTFNDIFENGAHYTTSGASPSSSVYKTAKSFNPISGSKVLEAIKGAGPSV